MGTLYTRSISDPLRTWNYINGMISTPLPNNSAAYYFVYKDGSNNYNCLNQNSGVIESTNSDPTVVIQYAITNTGGNPGKGTVSIDAGSYTLTSSLTIPTGGRVHIVGSGSEATILYAPTNAPVLIVDKPYITVEDMSLYSNQASYTSSVLQLKVGTTVSNFNRLTFYSGYNTGNAIEVYNDGAQDAFAGIYNCYFNEVNTNGFANAVKFTVTQRGNWITSIFFNKCLFYGSQKGVLCAGPVLYDGNTSIDACNFTDCGFQNGGPSVGGGYTELLTGFDYTDTCTHDLTVHTNVLVWDIAAGNTFMNTGTHSFSYTLQGCWPVLPRHFGGQGLDSSSAYGYISILHGNVNPGIQDALTSPMAGGRWGTAQVAGTTVGLDGILQAHTVVGTPTIGYDSNLGQYCQLNTGITANSNAGLVSPTGGRGIGRFYLAGLMKARFSIDSTTNGRLYFGLTSVTALPISDTPLGINDSGVIVGFNTADTNWTIRTNDGAGNAATVSQLSTPTTKDANIHTVSMNWGWNAAAVIVVFDGISTTVSTATPNINSDLFFNIVAQNSTTTARSLNLFGVYVKPSA